MVEKTAGYSGSDMRGVIQEAAQGPLREAARAMGASFVSLQPVDLRPVALRDFKVFRTPPPSPPVPNPASAA